MLITSIIRRRPCAGSKWCIDLLPLYGDCRGGGAGFIFLSIAVILTAALIFANIADYALFSAKSGLIKRGLDYAVCAAVQEIDVASSSAGLAAEFEENGGMPNFDGIRLDEAAADNAFFDTLKSNTGLERSRISPYILLVLANPDDTCIRYVLIYGNERSEGCIGDPEELEDVINSALTAHGGAGGGTNGGIGGGNGGSGNAKILVKGNLQTNEFKKRPYYLAVVNDFEIGGLFRKRTATFIGFAGAKIERRR